MYCTNFKENQCLKRTSIYFPSMGLSDLKILSACTVYLNFY